MAANTDNFCEVAVAGSETTLAAPGKSVGASSINITSASGWGTVTGTIFAMRRVDSNGNYVAGTYTEWAGVLSGTTLTINPTPLYGSDQTYAADGLTQVYIPVSASLWNRLVDTLLKDHFQNGGHGTLHDTNGKAILDLIATASAVNNLLIKNAATGNGPTLAVEGSDSNADLNIQPLGTGEVYNNGAALRPLAALNNFVESGCVITFTASTLNWSMTAGVVWVGGKRYNVAAASGTVTASKDTYFDVLVGANQNSASQTLVNTGGNIVANNAASPALAANSIRLGIVVAGTNITSINQGSPAATAPTVSSNVLTVCDSNGVLIYPTNPNGGIIGYRQITATQSVTSGTATVTGLSCPVIVPTGRKIKITVFSYAVYNVGSSGGTISVNLLEDGAGVQTAQQSVGPSTGSSQNLTVPRSITAGSHTYTVQIVATTNAQTQFNASSSTPAFVMVELE